MKRPRPKPDVAMEDAVARLVRKFEYPDRDTGPGVSPQGVKGGVPRIVIAASDASAESKAKADYVIAGNDLAVFQTVATLFGSLGGELRLTEGTFHPVGEEEKVEFANTWITGGGKGVTYINNNANFHFSGNSGYRDLSFFAPDFPT